MIIFSKIRFKNFFSYGNNFAEFDLNTHNTTLIRGKSGSGKTTIANAIYFALFNKLLKDLNKNDCINTVNNKNTVVELEFRNNGKNYKIVRGLKPNIFEIWEDGILVNQEASVRDYQTELETNILGGLNSTVFSQIVMIGSSSYVPFMKLKPSVRKDVIEDLLDLRVFSLMVDKLKEKLSINKEQLRDVENSIEISKEKIKIFKYNIQKQAETNNDSELKIQELILAENENIDMLLSKIRLCDERKKELMSSVTTTMTSIDQAISKYSSLLSDFKAKHTLSTNNKKFFSVNTSCPTCKQHIDEKYKADIIVEEDGRLESYNKGILQIQTKLKEFSKVKDEYSNINSSISNISQQITKFNMEIDASRKQLQLYNIELTKIHKNSISNTLKSDLETLEIQLENLLQDRQSLYDDKKYIENLFVLLKDGGVKNKIISRYIPKMNSIINQYLEKLNLPVEFTLDENFEEVIKSQYRDKFKYGNFSDGECQRIDLSIMLAWREIAKMKNTTSCNLLFFDETLDKSIDDSTAEILLEMFTTDMTNSNIFVISHKTLELFDGFDNVINFEKRGNFSETF